MTPSQLAQQALHNTGIDMAAINRIRSMGSRQLEKTDSESHKPFPHSQINSDNTSMRKRYDQMMKDGDSAEEEFDRASKSEQ